MYCIGNYIRITEYKKYSIRGKYYVGPQINLSSRTLLETKISRLFLITVFAASVCLWHFSLVSVQHDARNMKYRLVFVL